MTKETRKRFQFVAAEKANGVTYTPSNLAHFVARKILENADIAGKTSINVLDPAIGDGELILSLLSAIKGESNIEIEVHGFDTNAAALDEAARRIKAEYPTIAVSLTKRNFLEFVLDQEADTATPSLFSSREAQRFDLIIANPPYVRTQIMGAEQAQQLAGAFGLTGRVDLYQAFLLGMAQVLHRDGTAGMIVSNRFMTTKGGASLRSALREQFWLRQVWDLGDTKVFSAAVLPAVIIAGGDRSRSDEAPTFCSVYEATYETIDVPDAQAADPIAALDHKGVVEIDDGRKFRVKHGTLDYSGGDEAVWRIATDNGDAWLATVKRHSWAQFGDLGKIRVGVKTCADKIFIRHDWETELRTENPELLRPLTTHHGAGRFRAAPPKKPRSILYPHEVAQGQRQAVNLDQYPKSKAYLEKHRAALEARTYLIVAGRRWYEIWVPQDPQAWSAPKLVFRDISERPTFWIDLNGSVVNGDCYWLVANRTANADLLWLAAAIANSTFIEAFYDHCFNNKLYARRRRFITQYVEQFPLPDPATPLSKGIIERAKAIYDANHSADVKAMEEDLDKLVWEAFGLGVEEVRW